MYFYKLLKELNYLNSLVNTIVNVEFKSFKVLNPIKFKEIIVKDS